MTICKEMKDVQIAFEIFDGKGEDIPHGYQKIMCHMIFDIKIGENFRKKSRMVVWGYYSNSSCIDLLLSGIP